MKTFARLGFFAALVLCCLGPALSTADHIDEEFASANQKYMLGQYQEAVDFYEEILASGVVNGPLYYNLGNAYFRLGQKGKAILNYERAHRLMPQDKDLVANRAFVSSQLEQLQPIEVLRWYEKAFLAARDIFSVNGWAISLLVVYSLLFVMCLLAIFVVRLQKGAVRLAWFFVSLTMICAVFTATKILATERSQEGVLIQKVVDVRYSPALTGAVAFRLYEGIKVKRMACDGNWCHIRLTRDKSGWVERAMIEGI